MTSFAPTRSTLAVTSTSTTLRTKSLTRCSSSRYFIYGLPVFTINQAGQVAASDANADGLTLTVADLVYLIRVVVGDEQPYDKPSVEAVRANYSHDAGVVTIDGVDLGAAYIVVAGDVEPDPAGQQHEDGVQLSTVRTLASWSIRIWIT